MQEHEGRHGAGGVATAGDGGFDEGVRGPWGLLVSAFGYRSERRKKEKGGKWHTFDAKMAVPEANVSGRVPGDIDFD